MDNTHQYQVPFFFIILAGMFVVVFMMFQPFLNTLIVASTLAVVLSPIDQWFEKKLKGHPGISALLSILVALFVLAGPLSFLGLQLFDQSRGLYATLSNGSTFPVDIIHQIQDPIDEYFPQYNIDVAQYLRNTVGYISGNIGPLFSATLQTLFGLVLGILAVYFFLKDGPDLRKKMIQYSPLSDRADAIILDKVAKTMSSVMKGSLLIAVIQGAVAGLGFALFGVPNATLWGSVTAIASLIPGIGTGLVIIPTVIYLYFTGMYVQMIAMLLWGFLIVATVDNFVRPYLVSKDIDIHPFLILLSVLGGIGIFGPFGFLIGPIVLSLLLALLDVYQTVILKIKK